MVGTVLPEGDDGKLFRAISSLVPKVAPSVARSLTSLEPWDFLCLFPKMFVKQIFP